MSASDEARATVTRQAGVDQVLARLLALYRGQRLPLAATEYPSRSA